MDILPYIEPITLHVRKNSHKFCDVTLPKLNHDWLKKSTFHDVDQSKVILEGQ